MFLYDGHRLDLISRSGSPPNNLFDLVEYFEEVSGVKQQNHGRDNPLVPATKFTIAKLPISLKFDPSNTIATFIRNM